MVIKKALLATLAVSGVMYGSLAYADSHTVTVGYAQSKVQNFKDIRGVNLHYRYEWDSPVSIIGSFTHMKGDRDYKFSFKHNGKNYTGEDSLDMKYYSLMAGPAYRINDYLSVYGLLGFAHSKADATEGAYHLRNTVEVEASKMNRKSTNFAYGAGVEVNPIQSLSLYAGYEGASVKYNDNREEINGFNLGVGYRF
ncbi:Virulence membrane protein pagC precursor [Xenorhabdus bovienii str. Jollieti]|uniref:Virulence membrane protein pagC n=1 Tax=Xenorhabdus bovienii (strain SS-2004) TaxID=406818 RepID=D3UWC6_XENBS|nr:Ail/Lom family outer membrane beta-barrel protein [Xenorhabdus bovienii]CBJ79635.1 Virulence membrane protein pagC precursor [Xenorhabdus bovienii SS-2004]CDH28006.1 Virulence membrane protein pagC precursor [Xenorhabdus bovienii str. Jollieti]